MSDFGKQMGDIVNGYNNNNKDVFISGSDREQIKKQCDKWIIEIVEKVKSEILEKARKQEICYYNKTDFFGRSKRVDPHVYAGCELWFKWSPKEKVCERCVIKINDWDSHIAYKISDKSYFVYIFDEIIRKLSIDNITFVGDSYPGKKPGNGKPNKNINKDKANKISKEIKKIKMEKDLQICMKFEYYY